MKKMESPNPESAAIKPVVIVNFKTYPQATGGNALRLAQICEKVAKDLDADIRVAVQAADMWRVASRVSIPVYAQHVDPLVPGRNTGWLLPEAVREAGASGTLLNHSEHQFEDLEELREAVSRARKAGLDVVLCADTPKKVGEVKNLSPDFVAVEPPELIGGNVSVSTARPEIISDSRKECGDVPLLAGAGVKTGEDLRKSLEYGAVGVLLASGVAKANDPEKVLRGLLGAD